MRAPASIATSLALLLPGLASAATLSVGPSRTYTTIGAAVSAATGGDTIEVDPGSYRESLDLTEDLVFIGLGGSSNTEIRGTNTAIRIRDAAVEFHGFEVTNTTTGQGFNLDNGADVLLEDVYVHDQDNTGTVVAGGAFGGGVFVHNSTIELVDCVFESIVGGIPGHIRRQVTTRTECNAPILAREPPDLRLPIAVIGGELVHEDDRVTLARFFIVETSAF